MLSRHSRAVIYRVKRILFGKITSCTFWKSCNTLMFSNKCNFFFISHKYDHSSFQSTTFTFSKKGLFSIKLNVTPFLNWQCCRILGLLSLKKDNSRNCLNASKGGVQVPLKVEASTQSQSGAWPLGWSSVWS